MPKILQIRDDNLVRDLVRRKTVRVNDDMGGFFVDGLKGGGFACHQLDIRKAALYPLYGLLWYISPLRATKRPNIEGRYVPRARRLGVEPLSEFRVALQPPNRRTRKCPGGHLKGARRAPQADYRGPRPVTTIMVRTMDTKVRLIGENDKKLARMPKATKPK